MDTGNHAYARVNPRELKLQMEKQVGAAPTRQYFSYLNGLLSKKLNKFEFDKLCVLTLGQENLFLHNQLI
jgi:Transcriptional regulator of RNA polII, SAGA, subunit